MSDRASPYVGLVPYSESDADLFFGREREQRIIAANLRASRLTLLYGASGVGKSSVLLAGVVPELRRQVATSRTAGVRMRNGRQSLAVAERAPLAVAVLREWRDPPLPRLAEIIRASVIEACGDDDVEPWEPGTPLVDTLRDYTRRVRTLLVILDQFEEYFLYEHDERFDDEFAAVANQVDLRVHFMLSLREDALSQLDRFKGRIPGLFANYLRVDYLDRESARRAVVEPVALYDRAVGEGAPRSTVADDLVEEVLDEVRTGRLTFGEGQAPGDGTPVTEQQRDRIETPYLQLVMERLWEAGEQPDGRHVLTAQTLHDLGGAEAIVSSHLTEAMSSLSAEEEDVAATVFQFLVTPSRTKIAHRPSDLAFWAKRPAADVAGVLGRLAGERRIVRSLPPAPGEEEGRYEIFHDVLAEAVLEWCGRHEAERERAALAEKVREEDRARRKARRDRILRRLAIVLGLVIVGLLLLLIPALRERSQSREEERRTRSIGLAAAATGQIPIDPERAVLIAKEALAVDDTGRAREALVSAVAASHIRARMGHRRATACGELCRPGPVAPGFPPPAAAVAASYLGSGQQQQRVAFAPDGGTVAAVVDGQVRIWEPESGDYRTLPGMSNVDAVRIAPNGGRLLILDGAGVARVAALTGDRVWRVPGRTAAVALSPDGSFVAAFRQGRVAVWRVGRRVPLATVPAFAGTWNVEFSPVDPERLMVASPDAVTLWRWRTESPRALVGEVPTGGTQTAVVAAAGPGPIIARFSADGRSITHIDGSGQARVIDIAPLERHRPTPPAMISQAILSPRGDRVLTAEGRTAALRLPATSQIVATLGGHAGNINSAVFSPGGRLVATGSSDGTARVWDVASGNQTLELRGHSAAVTDVAFSPDGERLVTDAEDGSTRLWDVSLGQEVKVGPFASPVAAPRSDGTVAVFDREDGGIHVWTAGERRAERVARYGFETLTGAVSPDGRLVATTGTRSGRALVVRNLDTGEAKVIAGGAFDVLGFSPHGSRLFGLRTPESGGPAVARVWDTASGRELPLERSAFPEEEYDTVVWGPGDRVMVTSFDGPVRIVDSTSGRTLQAFWRHFRAQAFDASHGGGFNRNGKLVVTVGARQALVWRAETGDVVRRLQGHSARLTAAAFSPDSRWIATGDESGAIRIWDPATERTVGELPAHAGRVSGVAFTSDDQVLSTADDGSVRLYECVPCRSFDDLRSMAENRITRGLTRAERRAYLGESG